MLAPWVWTCALLAACGGSDDTREPGTELGTCVDGEFCEAGLACVDDVCVAPDQVDETEGAANGGGRGDDAPADSDTQDAGGADTGRGESGGMDTSEPTTEAHCELEPDANLCRCTAGDLAGPPNDDACTPDTVPGRALCCASEDWPEYEGCSCQSVACVVDSEGICECDLYYPFLEGEVVSSCSANDGVCCRADDGSSCWCSPVTVGGNCPPEMSPVSSCSTTQIECQYSTVSVSTCRN